MTTTTSSRYVIRQPEILSGEPIIAGTRTPIRAIVENWRLGLRPEEIPLHLPHLTLVQVFDALSFYLDNQTEINEYIERNQVPDELVSEAIYRRLGCGQTPRRRQAFIQLRVLDKGTLTKTAAA